MVSCMRCNELPDRFRAEFWSAVDLDEAPECETPPPKPNENPPILPPNPRPPPPLVELVRLLELALMFSVKDELTISLISRSREISAVRDSATVCASLRAARSSRSQSTIAICFSWQGASGRL